MDSTAGVEELQSILQDTRTATHPICRHQAPALGSHMVGTVASVVMDLPRRQLHVTEGNPRQNPYGQFVLE